MLIETGIPRDIQKIPLTVLIDEEKNTINKTASEIFSNHYTDLLNIYDDSSQKLTELKNRKLTLDNTWAKCFFEKKEVKCIALTSRWRIVTVITTLALGIINCILLGVGYILKNTIALIVGIVGIVFTGLAYKSASIIPYIPGIKETLVELSKVNQEIDQLEIKLRQTKKLIKLSNRFAAFCKEWSQVRQNIKKHDVKHLFAKLRRTLKVYKSNVQQSADQSFLRLAPLFLMDKVTNLLQDGKIVSSWQELKQSPTLWGTKDISFWRKVQMHIPSKNDYLLFLKLTLPPAQMSDLDINELEEDELFQSLLYQTIDPDKWQEWMKEKLKTFVVQSGRRV